MAQQQSDSGVFAGDFRRWREVATGLARFPALTLIIFMRMRCGFRLLSYASLFGTAFFLFLLNGIGNLHVAIPLAGRFGATNSTESLRNFALLFLALGLWQRHLRWRELLSGVLWHTRSRGVSYFEFLPLRLDWVYRFVDPILAFLGGMCIRKLGYNGLGLWIMFSALCLRIVEDYAHEKSLERECDIHDSLVENEVMAETAAHFAGQNNADVKVRSLKDTGGIPTGADATLEAQIAKRKRDAASRKNDGDLAGVRS